jgi:integrase
LSLHWLLRKTAIFTPSAPRFCWVVLLLKIRLSRRQTFNLPALRPQLVPIVLNEWWWKYDLASKLSLCIPRCFNDAFLFGPISPANVSFNNFTNHPDFNHLEAGTVQVQGYRKRPSALTPQQITLLFKTIDTDTILGIRDYAVYALMYQLGLRVGEVHSLNLADLDIKNKKISVLGKGKKPRTLYINEELIEILCQYLSMRDQFCNCWLTPSLFVSKKGNRLAIRTMEDNFKKILFYSCLNVPFNVTCHTLRHSMASHLNDKDVDILVIQSILGHSSTRSTEPYIHPSQDRIRKAMEKLPGVKFVKELIRKGELELRFQKSFRPKRE